MAKEAAKYITLLRDKINGRTSSGPAQKLRAFQQFRFASRSSDNLIDEVEFRQSLINVGLLQKSDGALSKRIFKAIDLDNSGSINYSEFVEKVLGLKNQRTTLGSARRNDKRERNLKKQVRWLRDF